MASGPRCERKCSWARPLTSLVLSVVTVFWQNNSSCDDKPNRNEAGHRSPLPWHGSSGSTRVRPVGRNSILQEWPTGFGFGEHGWPGDGLTGLQGGNYILGWGSESKSLTCLWNPFEYSSGDSDRDVSLATCTLSRCCLWLHFSNFFGLSRNKIDWRNTCHLDQNRISWTSAYNTICPRKVYVTLCSKA